MNRVDVVELVVDLVDVDLDVGLVDVDLDVDLVDVDLVDVDLEVDFPCDRITRQECFRLLVLKNAPQRTSQYVQWTSGARILSC